MVSIFSAFAVFNLVYVLSKLLDTYKIFFSSMRKGDCGENVRYFILKFSIWRKQYLNTSSELWNKNTLLYYDISKKYN